MAVPLTLRIPLPLYLPAAINQELSSRYVNAPLVAIINPALNILRLSKCLRDTRNMYIQNPFSIYEKETRYGNTRIGKIRIASNMLSRRRLRVFVVVRNERMDSRGRNTIGNGRILTF